jgi:hypothetical protein
LAGRGLAARRAYCYDPMTAPKLLSNINILIMELTHSDDLESLASSILSWGGGRPQGAERGGPGFCGDGHPQGTVLVGGPGRDSFASSFLSSR